MTTPRRKKRAAAKPLTTAQQLESLIKSARDIMRKDKGLSTDLDRLPMLTWIMFLKFLDDMEQIEESKAKLRGEKHRSAIEPPYRWRDWAAREGGMTGRDLLAFINQDEATLPHGKRGPGLFAYLRSLRGGNGGARRRQVIATVFSGVVNRMTSGYLLRDVINKVNRIHFLAKEELFTLGHLYESMLKEMRDAAGENGEFYTPRSLVQFMVRVIDPRLDETVLDPACGTGGFLVEAYHHLELQCKTVADRKRLQTGSLLGGEAKPLPYLLSQMNLLLHGLDVPQIDPQNSLRFRISELGNKDRVDVILTNPPFGGQEEAGIKANFPPDMQASETALLFLQLIMRKLKRPGRGSAHGGRAAVVVPNGTLYDSGVAERIRRQLLTEFRLPLIVRLPKGVFLPYTDIATNILFFDTLGPTDRVWFYEHPLPEHRAHLKSRTYTATDGLEFDELAPVLEWWKAPLETDNAWALPASQLLSGSCDFALTHPNRSRVAVPRAGDLLRQAFEVGRNLPTALEALERRVASIEDLRAPLVPLAEILKLRTDKLTVASGRRYRRPRVQLHFRGAVVRDEVDGADIGTKTQTAIRTDDLLMSRIDARNGALAIVPPELHGAIATNDFPAFEIDRDRTVPSYLRFVLFQPQMLHVYEQLSRGSTNRRRLDVGEFLSLKIPLPANLVEQTAIADALQGTERQISAIRESLTAVRRNLDGVLGAALHQALEVGPSP